MKCSLSKKLSIKVTLDSSEAVMFNQGGLHKVQLPPVFKYENFDEIEVSVQIERNAQTRHNFILNEALAHKQRMAKEQEDDSDDPDRPLRNT